MREFKIRYGKFAGHYNIYDSREEFHKSFPDIKIKVWPVDAPFEIDDWIEAEDGYILQLLGISKPFIKRDAMISREERIYHFANCGIRYYSYKGKQKYNRFFGMIATYNRYSYDKSPLDAKGDLNTKLFVNLVKNNVPIIKAFLTSFEQKKKHSKPIIFRKILQVLEDPDVMEEFRNQLTPFQKRIIEGVTDEQIADQFIDIALNPLKKGSKEHVTALNLLSKIKGINLGNENISLPTPVKQLPEEAEYSVIPNIEKPEKN